MNKLNASLDAVDTPLDAIDTQELFTSLLRTYYDLYPLMLFYGVHPCSMDELGEVDVELVAKAVFMFEILIKHILAPFKDGLVEMVGCGDSIPIANLFKLNISDLNKEELQEFLQKAFAFKQVGGGNVNGKFNMYNYFYKGRHSRKAQHGGARKWETLEVEELQRWFGMGHPISGEKPAEPGSRAGYVSILTEWYGPNVPQLEDQLAVVNGEGEARVEGLPGFLSPFNVGSFRVPLYPANNPRARNLAATLYSREPSVEDTLSLTQQDIGEAVKALAGALTSREQVETVKVALSHRTDIMASLTALFKEVSDDIPLISLNQAAISAEIFSAIKEGRDVRLENICRIAPKSLMNRLSFSTKRGKQLSEGTIQLYSIIAGALRQDPYIVASRSAQESALEEINNVIKGTIIDFLCKVGGLIGLGMAGGMAYSFVDEAILQHNTDLQSRKHERALKAYNEKVGKLNAAAKKASDDYLKRLAAPSVAAQAARTARDARWNNAWEQGEYGSVAGQIATRLSNGLGSLGGWLTGAATGILSGAVGGIGHGARVGWYGGEEEARIALEGPPPPPPEFPPMPELVDPRNTWTYTATSAGALFGTGLGVIVSGILVYKIYSKVRAGCTARAQMTIEIKKQDVFVKLLMDTLVVSQANKIIHDSHQPLLTLRSVVQRAPVDQSALLLFSQSMQLLNLTNKEKIPKQLRDQFAIDLRQRLTVLGATPSSQLMALLPPEDLKKLKKLLLASMTRQSSKFQELQEEMYNTMAVANRNARAQLEAIGDAGIYGAKQTYKGIVSAARGGASLLGGALTLAGGAASSVSASLPTVFGAVGTLGGPLGTAAGWAAGKAMQGTVDVAGAMVGATGRGLSAVSRTGVAAGRAVTGANAREAAAAKAKADAAEKERKRVLTERLGALWSVYITLNENFYTTDLEDIPKTNSGSGGVLKGENADLYEAFKRAYAQERENPGYGRRYLQGQMILSNLGNLPDPAEHEITAARQRRAPGGNAAPLQLANAAARPGGNAAPLQLGNAAARPGGGAAAGPPPPVGGNTGGGRRKHKSKTRKHKKAKRLGKRGTRKY